MLNPSLYEPIFTRKSVREYADTPLSPAQLDAVREEIAKAVPLLPEEKYKLELGEAREGWRIYGFCENTPKSNVNLGFLMQQLDLALHIQGLGRLWFGFGRAPSKLKAPAGLSYAMCLRIGVASEPIERAPGEFMRKPITEVVDEDALRELLDPVRLAPSARNVQPWYFTAGTADKIFVWRKPPKIKLILDRMHWVDMGIALCHMVLSLERKQVNFEISFDEAKRLEGYDYFMTVKRRAQL